MITQKRLMEVLRYDRETGIFTWKKTRSGCAKYSTAGGYTGSGYWKVGIDGKNYMAHRLAFLYCYGYFPENDIDHINRTKDDNRISNLREASRTCNSRNKGIGMANKSGVIGVSLSKTRNKWEVKIQVGGKSMHLGYYEDFGEAVKARWEAEVKFDFPNCNTTSSAYKFLEGAL